MITMPTLTTEYIEAVPIAKIAPNPWNPNVESDFTYERVKGSLERWGMIGSIIVREVPDGYQVIGGEHRWRALGELGRDVVPVHVVRTSDGSPVSDDTVKRLIPMLNVQGVPDDLRLSDLIRDLAEAGVDVGAELAFTQAELERLMALSGGDFDYTATRPGGGGSTDDDKEPWSTLSWELPSSAAKVVMQAVRKARGDDDHEWMGLERIAADYLAGPDA